jgi:hypothetical protein
VIAPRKNAPKTRGKPFARGNPGRPKGARHKVTLFAEKLMQSDVENIVNAVLTAARAGDMSAARIVLDRIAPIRKGAPLEIDIPAAKTPGDLVLAFEALIAAVTKGEASPDEAMTIAGVLGEQRRAIELTEIEQRLALIEKTIAEGKASK